METRPIRKFERQAGWYSPSLLSRLLSRSCGGFCQAWPRRDGEDGPRSAERIFGICARLLPNDVRVTVEQSLPGNLSPSDWADLRELLSAIQSALPDAADRAPGEVFQIVRDALGKPQGNSLSEIEPRSGTKRPLIFLENFHRHC